MEEAQNKSCHEASPAGRAPPVAATAFTSLLKNLGPVAATAFTSPLKNLGKPKTATYYFKRIRDKMTAFSLAMSGT